MLAVHTACTYMSRQDMIPQEGDREHTPNGKRRWWNRLGYIPTQSISRRLFAILDNGPARTL